MYIKYLLVFVEITFVEFFIFKIYAPSTHSYAWLKNHVKKFFIIIWLNSSIKVIFKLSDTICQVQTYMISFLKQTKCKLKKSHSKDFLEILCCL